MFSDSISISRFRNKSGFNFLNTDLRETPVVASVTVVIVIITHTIKIPFRMSGIVNITLTKDAEEPLDSLPDLSEVG